MSSVRVGAEMFEGGVRAVAAEQKRDGWHIRWYGTLRGEGEAAERGRELGDRLRKAGIHVDEMYVALPTTPGAIFSALELPPLSASELRSVAETELRRERKLEPERELSAGAWQYGGAAGGTANTLAAVLPPSLVDDGLSFARTLDAPLRVLAPSVAVVHQTLLAAEEIPEAGATALVHLGERFGTVVYVRGPRWLSSQVFPLPGPGEAPDAESVVREIRRSYMGFRSQASGLELNTLVLAGPQMPEEDLALKLQEELPEARIELFGLRERLRLEGLPSAGDFLRRQIEYAVPLLLVTRGEEVKLDFRPPSFRIPELKGDLLRRLGVAAGAAGLAVLLHWGWVDYRKGEAREGAAETRDELARIEPKLASLRQAEEMENRLALYRGARDLSRQQPELAAGALRALSLAAGDRVGVDSLSLQQGGAGLQLVFDGSAYGESPSTARRAFDRFLFDLRRSPIFTDAAVARQELVEEGADGTPFTVQFRVRAAVSGTVEAEGRDAP